PVGAAAMGARGGLLCAASGLVLLLTATATDFWVQQRAPGGAGCQGLWRVCVGSVCLSAGPARGAECCPHAALGRCHPMPPSEPPPAPAGLLALLGLAVYTAVTGSVFGKLHAEWRFSWSYILGWIAVVLVVSAGSGAPCVRIHKCAQVCTISPRVRMSECPPVSKHT
uniref:Lens fiber membrane intrinsic protein n=1 Tax=Apteryx owenii TaxID=8824 RepID=A0A8B9S8W4_APTOW